MNQLVFFVKQMITGGQNNINLGQFQETQYSLFNNITYQMKDNFIFLHDQDAQELVRFFIDQGLLKYQVTINGVLQSVQTLTDPAIQNVGDSLTLPFNPNSTRIDLNNNMFQVFLQNVQRLLLDSQQLQLGVSNIQINNNTQNITLKMKSLLGQKIQIQDTDTLLNLLELNSTSVDIKNKKILGVQTSSDLTSAVNLDQLTNFKPRYLKTAGLQNDIQILNQSDQQLANITNSAIQSNIPLQYNTRPSIFGQTTMVDVQKVQDILQDYEPIAHKNQPNGYAGLTNTGTIDPTIQSANALKIQSQQISSFGNQPVTTDNLVEGVQNQYFTNTRALYTIQSQKGAINGICPLDANLKIPQQYIQPIPDSSIFSGLDTQKTNALNPAYSQQTPIVGDKYISTDTSNVYILNTLPFTNSVNWTQISFVGVTSVNGQSGIVSLNTDNITEGTTNKYFQSGLTNYLASNAGTANQLAKLNTGGFIPSSNLNSSLVLNGGSINIVDDQFSSLSFKNNANQDPILTLQTNQVLSSKQIRYSQNPTITLNNDVTHKQYVDNAIQNHIGTQLVNNNTSIITSTNDISTTVAGNQTLQMQQTQTTSKVPILYDNVVSMIDQKQLATKEYVDNILSDFINGSGANKEFIQATSNVPVTSNQKIPGWVVGVQSQTDDRIQFNINDTFTLTQGVYSFYLGIQLSEFVNTGLVSISAVVRDSNTHQEYFYFQFQNNFDSSGGDQKLTMAYPFVWKFTQQTTVEVYVTSNNVQSGVYNSYITIEEIEKIEATIGRDRITDPGLQSKVQLTDLYLDFNVNNVQYGQMTQNALNLEQNIKVKYNSLTPINEEYQLVTKKYVDTEVSLATATITDLGQLIQVGMTTDQTTGLNVGGTVQLNNVIVNTSLTISVSNLGVVTFLPGFIYRVYYNISCRFLSNTGFCILGFKDQQTLQIITGSQLYILMTQNSNDSQVGSTMFYVDLRSANVSHNYQLVIVQQQNLQQVYKNFSTLSAEQVQQIQEQLFDRIQNVDISSQIKLYNQKIETKLNNQLIEKKSNSSGSVVTEQQIVDTDQVFVAQAGSHNFNIKAQLPSTDTQAQRLNSIQSDINGQVQGVLQTRILDNISANLKQVEVGGINAQIMYLFTNGVNNAQMKFYNATMGELIPIICLQPIGLDPSVSITENKQLVTKEYVDNSQLFPIGGICIWSSANPPTNYLICDGSSFLQATYPDLFTALGSNVLPDYRGYFVRGLEQSATPSVETTANRQINTIQSDTNKAHTHTVNDQFNNSRTDNIYAFFDSNVTFAYNSYTSRTVTSSSQGGPECRPKNISAHYIIRAK